MCSTISLEEEVLPADVMSDFLYVINDKYLAFRGFIPL